MAHLQFSFAFKGELFCLCCTVKGTSIRHYKVVSGEYELVNPDFNYWNPKAQRFIEPSLDAINNNNKLNAMLKHYQEFYNKVSESTVIQDGKALFALEANGSTMDKPTVTFEEFIQQLINEKKYTQNKKPSKSYQLYITLLHKLQMEGTIGKKYLASINNSDFISFGRFILNRLSVADGKYNYLKLMKLFKSAHSEACSRELNTNSLHYCYTKDAPTKDCKERTVLTQAQIEQFRSLDLSTVQIGCADQEFQKELYRDFCIFMYETKMRPCDVLKLKSSDIEDHTIMYVPEKKKNYLDERKRIVKTFMSPTALDILNKYCAVSVAGYVFPFPMNNHYWDFNDAASWNKWNNRKQKTLENINQFLHKVEPLIGAHSVTLYTFRHSAFTHAINSPNCNLLRLAKEGGTSIKMLESHYYHLDNWDMVLK